jgi:adenylate kinase
MRQGTRISSIAGTSDIDITEDEKTAGILFEKILTELHVEFTGKNLSFPEQVVFLSGAPGAGKGTNTPAVMHALKISNKPVEVSSLLHTPECEELKRNGQLVDDDTVIRQVIRELLRPHNTKGVIIDGFPRTAVQAYFLKYLVRTVDSNTSSKETEFKMINFSVSCQTSINRQLSRGKVTMEQNQKLGQNEVPIRETDLSESAATRRYQTYVSSIHKCMSILQDNIKLYVIDAEGSIEDVRENVHNALGNL